MNRDSVVYKQVLKRAPLQTIEVPDGAQFLCVHDQRGEIVVWYRCEPTMPLVTKTISIVSTGHEAGDVDQWRHLGTAFIGEHVWHVFEMVLPPPEPFVGLEPVTED